MDDKKDAQDSSVVKRLSMNYMNMNAQTAVSNIGRNTSESSLTSPNHMRDFSQNVIKSTPIFEESESAPNEFTQKMCSKIEMLESNQSKLYSLINEINKKLVIIIIYNPV